MTKKKGSGESVPGFPGIKKKSNGKFLATKSIKRERFYKEFPTLREASEWKKFFHPIANKEGLKHLSSLNLASPFSARRPIASPTQDQDTYFNGRNKTIILQEVLAYYCKGPLKALSKGTQYMKRRKLEVFLSPLFTVRLCELTSEVITDHLVALKIKEEEKKISRRYSFKEELKFFRSLLNWYREEKDITFTVPITKYHGKLGQLRPIKKKDKILSVEKVCEFLEYLPDPFYTLALVQYTYALRVGEAAALSIDNVNFERRILRISETLEYFARIIGVREETKTGVVTDFVMIPEIETRLRALDILRPKGCKFFFHFRGQPLSYDMIRGQYKIALRKAGIKGVAGTHFLRFSMATSVRREKGLDASQAILRHKSSAMSETYAVLDPTIANEVVIDFQERLRSIRATTVRPTFADINDSRDLNDLSETS